MGAKNINRLKQLRESKGLTRKEIAKFLYISYNTYWAYENGKRAMPVDVLSKLSKFYKVSEDYLNLKTNYKLDNAKDKKKLVVGHRLISPYEKIAVVIKVEDNHFTVKYVDSGEVKRYVKSMQYKFQRCDEEDDDIEFDTETREILKIEGLSKYKLNVKQLGTQVEQLKIELRIKSAKIRDLHKELRQLKTQSNELKAQSKALKVQLNEKKDLINDLWDLVKNIIISLNK